MVSISSTGRRIAFNRWSNETWTWKRYRGGTAPDIWLGDLDAGIFQNLTDDPAKIRRSRRSLPIGYWKGSGLALLLDCIASSLAAGDATFQISHQSDETSVSQIFIAIDLSKTGSADLAAQLIPQILADVHSATPNDPNAPVTFPGERRRTRQTSALNHGIEVETAIWEKVQNL